MESAQLFYKRCALVIFRSKRKQVGIFHFLPILCSAVHHVFHEFFVVNTLKLSSSVALFSHVVTQVVAFLLNLLVPLKRMLPKSVVS